MPKKEPNMNIPKDKSEKTLHDDIQDHYEFDYEKAKPNRFAPHLSQDAVMVVLDPDVAALFPTSEAVNATLRALAAALKNLQSSSSV